MLRTVGFIALALFATACSAPRYTVARDSNPQLAMAANVLFVGWLSIDPGQYAQYQYKSAAEFQQVIVGMNDALQRGLRTDMPDKRMAFPRSPFDRPPPGVEMIVFFDNPVIANTGSASAGQYLINPFAAGSQYARVTVTATVRIFDTRLQREVRTARITATPSGLKPEWRMFNLEAVLEQCAYNLGCFITESLGV
jgi:hypothetical protein